MITFFGSKLAGSIAGFVVYQNFCIGFDTLYIRFNSYACGVAIGADRSRNALYFTIYFLVCMGTNTLNPILIEGDSTPHLSMFVTGGDGGFAIEFSIFFKRYINTCPHLFRDFGKYAYGAVLAIKGYANAGCFVAAFTQFRFHFYFGSSQHSPAVAFLCGLIKFIGIHVNTGISYFTESGSCLYLNGTIRIDIAVKNHCTAGDSRYNRSTYLQ